MPRVDTVDDIPEFKRLFGELLSTAFSDNSRASFGGSGTLSDAPNPGLNIEGIGLIGLPLSQLDANRIISQSEQAPYGKKDQTLVNLLVRRTWQIDASKIHLRNPSWIDYLQERIIPKIGETLGVEVHLIDARLYKLLLYGEGGHFEAHQDTEKEPGMFGTLIIVLPSPFTGGHVTLTHGSKEKIFDTAPNSDYGTSYTCIYTDVFHKVHPVTSGYRLALSYNLILKYRSPTVTVPRAPPTDTSLMLQLRDTFKEWLARLEAGQKFPDFIAHVLDYRYSKVGLDFNNLKGEDRSKIFFLKDIASELGFTIQLSQFKIHVGGYGSDHPDHPVYKTNSRSYNDSIYEISRTYSLKQAVDCDGNEMDLSKLKLGENELTSLPDIADWKINRGHGETYTGNAHGDIHHCMSAPDYYQTAVIMWPKSQDLIMSFKGGGEMNASLKLKKLALSYKTAKLSGTNSDRQFQEFNVFLKAILTNATFSCKCVDATAIAAISLESLEIYLKLAKSSASYDIKSSTWVEAVKLFGSAALRDAFDSFISSYLPSDPDLDGSKCTENQKRLDTFKHILDSFPDDLVINSVDKLRTIFQQLRSKDLDDECIKALAENICTVGFGQFRQTIYRNRQTICRLKELFERPRKLSTDNEKIGKVIEELLFILPRQDKEFTSWTEAYLIPYLLKLDVFDDMSENLALLTARRVGFKSSKLLFQKINENSRSTSTEKRKYCEKFQKIFHNCDDQELKTWTESSLTSEFLNFSVFDDISLNMILQHARTVGFSKSQNLLISMLNKIEDSRGNYSYGHAYIDKRFVKTKTAIEVIVEIFKTFTDDAEATNMCRVQLQSLIYSRDSLTGEEILAMVEFVQLCIKHQPSLIPQFLIHLRRPFYSANYLTDIIEPFVKAMKPVLEKLSLSFKIAPYDSFAEHFVIAANIMLRSSEPSLPDDYSLPPVNDEAVDHFLKLHLHHEFRFRTSLNIRKDTERSLNGLLDAVGMETDKSDGSPHTLVIRKTKPKPRTDTSLKKVLTPLTESHWRSALCSRRYSCAVCQKITKCLQWHKTRQSRNQFLTTFGASVADPILDNWAASSKSLNPLCDITSVKVLQTSTNMLGQKRTAEEIIDSAEFELEDRKNEKRRLS